MLANTIRAVGSGRASGEELRADASGLEDGDGQAESVTSEPVRVAGGQMEEPPPAVTGVSAEGLDEADAAALSDRVRVYGMIGKWKSVYSPKHPPPDPALHETVIEVFE